MNGRALTLGTALVMAAVAVTSVYFYVGRVENETFQGLQTREVLVATQFLPAGLQGIKILQADAFEMKEVPLKYVSPGALDKPQDVAGLTLVDDVTAGEQLTSSRFANENQNFFVADMPNGTEALSLPLEPVRGVSGHLQRGDRINAYATGEGKKGTAALLRKLNIPSSARVFDPEDGVTVLLFKDMLVVEVPDSSPTSGEAASLTAPTITLAVTEQQAAHLIYAQERAKLWFTLAKGDGS